LNANGTVTVPAGATPTQIIFCNRPATGSIKVCKDLAAGTTAPAGTLFNFTVSGQPNVSVAPGQCTLIQNVSVGTTTVAEVPMSGFAVTAINFTSGSGTANVGAGSAAVTVTANGTTEVHFVNTAATTLKICKAAIAGLSGTGFFFQFTVAGNTYYAPLGQCTQVITNVPSGAISFTEATMAFMQSGGTFTAVPGTSFSVSGATSLGGAMGVTTSGQTINAILASGQENVIQVTNTPAMGSLEICKVGASSLVIGQTFNFTVGNGVGNVAVTAGAAPGGFCQVVPTIAGPVSVTEQTTAGFQVAPNGIVVSPSAAGSGNVATATANVTITANQITTVTFTNQVIPPPSGVITCTVSGFTGTTLNVSIQASAGLARIVEGPNTSNMSAVSISPANFVGLTTPVTASATVINPQVASVLELLVTDQNGTTLKCDPVQDTIRHASEHSATGHASIKAASVYTGISQTERWFTVHNGKPGLLGLKVTVNGHVFTIGPLKKDAMRTIDISSALKPGTNNIVTVRAMGKASGSATILISDMAMAGGSSA